MLPTLPSGDPDAIARADGLARARTELTYAYDRPAGIAMAASLPSRFGFPLGVIAQVAKGEAELLANRAAVRVAQGLHPVEGGTPSTLASCAGLFALIGAPPIVEAMNDEAFAWQRVGGANPFVLARVDRLPESLPLAPSVFTRVTGGDRLEAAAAEARLYLADYAVLDGIEGGVTLAGVRRYLSAPLALFVRDARGTRLRPIAIQCGQTPDASTPIFTPEDGAAWEMARVAVQVADVNVEESFHHLGRAHFLIEAFALAMERQLSERHPLFVLLGPHFLGTLAINGAARDQLVVPGGQLDELMAPALEGSLALVRKGLSSFELDTASFATDLQQRGLDDATALPEHPYRDDGKLVHTAITSFVRDYLALVYGTDAAVAGDEELAAFVRELRADDGGRLRGVPERIETVERLGNLIAFVIFTTSARHAALNYTQGDFMGYAPNMPTAAFAPPPSVAGGDRDQAWSRVLPSRALASSQLEFMWKQSQIRDDRLGRYPRNHFADPRVAPILARFQASLAHADERIAERDAMRLLPYPYLRPSLLTASIHI